MHVQEYICSYTLVPLTSAHNSQSMLGVKPIVNFHIEVILQMQAKGGFINSLQFYFLRCALLIRIHVLPNVEISAIFNFMN